MPRASSGALLVTAPERRAPLPDDPDSLPPMGDAFDRGIASGLRELGLDATRAGSVGARHSYEAHARLLTAWGAAINLTAIREPGAIARRHVCDSLSAVEVLAPGQIAQRSTVGQDERTSDAATLTLLDLGSGGGYPGLPLAAAHPWRRVALVESVAKKARFLSVAAPAVTDALREAGLEVPPIDVVAERAEDLADDPDERAAWDVVTVRAVGTLAESVELALPLLRLGGRLVAWRRDSPVDGLRAELRDAGSIIRACGGGPPRVLAVPLPELPDHRLVVVVKERPTPATYPRDPSRRARRR